MEEYCIIARERSRRPSDFKVPKAEKGRKRCPFCPGNEEMTPPATAVYKDGQVLKDGEERVRGWQVRCVPNLYPAVSEDPGALSGDWLALPGYGSHEVIIESPDHDKDPSRFDQTEMELMLSAYRDRYVRGMGMEGVRYVSIFKNWGEIAGASLSHTHTQLVALPLLPPMLMREAAALSTAPFCLYCNLVVRETSSTRLVAENDGWVQIAPFFSQSPYETWILPKDHASSLEDLDDGQLSSLARILRDSLGRQASLLDDPPYNYMVYQLSRDHQNSGCCQPSRGYHLNIRIQPVTSKVAGFEKNTGMYINPVPPEQAASELKEIDL